MRLAFIRTSAADDYGDEFQSAMASEYEQGTPWTRMRLENVRLLVDPRPGDRVLDIGTAAERSTPTGSQPSVERKCEIPPAAVPMSSTRSPGRGSTRSRTFSRRIRVHGVPCSYSDAMAL